MRMTDPKTTSQFRSATRTEVRTLAEKIASAEFVVTTELTPPKGIDLSDLYARADALKPYVDAVNLTDSPRARMAVEPKSVGHLLLDRGIEPIIQITARDRNRIAIQGDLLGGALLGIRNYVFMTGDQPKHGDHPEAKGVFEWTASDMLRAARALSSGRDVMGIELKGSVDLFVGATVNPAADDFEAEVVNTRRKIDAGAQFLQTQALYDVHVLEKFLDELKPPRIAILAGIIPLKSFKMATWLNENVPGIRVPDSLLTEMSGVSTLEKELNAGIEIAARIMRDVRPLCAGIHVMAMGWEQHVPEMLRRAVVRK
jgi:methylenetetrahydrofolate reductase (NADPH)